MRLRGDQPYLEDARQRNRLARCCSQQARGIEEKKLGQLGVERHRRQRLLASRAPLALTVERLGQDQLGDRQAIVARQRLPRRLRKG